MQVERSILICFVARSGSTHLCGLLGYDRAAVAGLLRLIAEESDDSDRWLAGQRIAPHEVTDEHVRADPHGAVAGIAAAAGVELPVGVELRGYPGVERQADALDAEWIERFRAESAA